jgi:pimeloyl-ACP methyl ester carboxylesterase
MSRRRVQVGAHGLSLLEYGEGPNLLYLHGSGDQGGLLPVHRDLGAHLRVLRPDLPGFGDSDDLPPGARVHDVALLVAGLLDELRIDDTTVFGSSLGGWVAADLAATLPERVSRLLLVAPAGLNPPGGPVVDQFALEPDALVDATFYDPSLRAQAKAGAAARTDDEAFRRRQARHLAATRALGADPYFHDPGLHARLAAISAPTLIVWGESDGLQPATLAPVWQQAIPNAEAVVIPACGHLPHVERRTDFLDLARPFLELPDA